MIALHQRRLLVRDREEELLLPVHNNILLRLFIHSLANVNFVPINCTITDESPNYVAEMMIENYEYECLE